MPYCSSCKGTREEALFKKNFDGSLVSTCTPCSTRKSSAKKKKENQGLQARTGSAQNKENVALGAAEEEGEDGLNVDDNEDISYLGKVPLAEFLETISSLQDVPVRTMTAQVDLSSLGSSLVA